MDLQFAPAWVYPRFQKFSREQVIGAETRTRVYGSSDLEPWCKKWHEAIFNPSASQVTLGAYQDILSSLDADPTSVRRLFLLEELQERLLLSPTAAVGSLDVLESLAPAPADCLMLKEKFLERAIGTVRSHLPSSDSYDSLRLINDRLLKTAYQSVSENVFISLKSAVSAAASADLGQSLSLTEPFLRQKSPSSREANAFVDGLLEELDKIVTTEPGKLSVLRDFSQLAPGLLARCPSAATGYLLAAGSDSGARDTASREVLGWLNQISDRSSRHEIRAKLLPWVMKRDFLPLFAHLVSNLDGEEAKEVLEMMAGKDDAILDQDVLQVIKANVSTHFGAELKAWAISLKSWFSGVAALIAATFPRTQHGFSEMLQEDRWKGQQKAEILAHYLADWDVQWFPEWLYTTAKDSSAFWDQLLASGGESSPEIDREILRFLPGIYTAPGLISLGPDRVAAFKTKRYYDQLNEVVIRTAGWQSIVGVISKQELALWNELSPSWYAKANLRELETIVAQYRSSPQGTPARAWQWILLAPESLYRRNPAVISPLIDGIILTTGGKWPPECTSLWLQVLKRINHCSSYDAKIKLFIKALRFSFANRKFPLGAIVAYVFSEVHEVATDKKSSIDTSSLFGFFDWDKGKQLRRDLIDSFTGSEWSPAELALAPKNATLLRKIVKRLLRTQHGDRYLERMLSDLRDREEPEYQIAKRQLNQIVTNLDYQEEWD